MKIEIPQIIIFLSFTVITVISFTDFIPAYNQFETFFDIIDETDTQRQPQFGD